MPKELLQLPLKGVIVKASFSSLCLPILFPLRHHTLPPLFSVFLCASSVPLCFKIDTNFKVTQVNYYKILKSSQRPLCFKHLQKIDTSQTPPFFFSWDFGNYVLPPLYLSYLFSPPFPSLLSSIHLVLLTSQKNLCNMIQKTTFLFILIFLPLKQVQNR
jgi:hypothetical protein